MSARARACGVEELREPNEPRDGPLRVLHTPFSLHMQSELATTRLQSLKLLNHVRPLAYFRDDLPIFSDDFKYFLAIYLSDGQRRVGFVLFVD